MARQARGEYLNPHEIQVVHAVQRCVRQAFLCGLDKNTGTDYEYRREWIRDRLEFLASVFGIDCLTYTVMSNHLHLVLRSRPDVVAQWSDEEVARRWWRVFPQKRDKNGHPTQPTGADLGMIVNHPARLAQIRSRLSDVSWWMRCTAETIARRANKEEKTSGRFWQGRFRAQPILDEASLLACAAYVDLNPIRAAMAKTPETSEFTGAKDRIDDLKDRSSTAGSTHDWERSRRRRKSGWLSPIEIDEKNDPVGADVNPTPRRASQKGFLPISLTQYLELLDWTGRVIRSDKRGSIPAHLGPILSRIGMEAGVWCDLVKKFGRLFKRVAGTAEALAAEASRRGQNYLQAPALELMRPSTT
jgi:REP element-mobilizing transposase RayT